MSRPLRLAYPGALYHVTARGNRRSSIYRDDADRTEFNVILGDVVERYSWLVYAWCQMTNHYHLLVETPEPNLSDGMRHLNGRYANYFNRRHRLVGHVFQSRFFAIHVDGGKYLRELLRYVVLNPVRAEVVEQPEAWQWSSYREMVAARMPPIWSAIDRPLSLFGTTRHNAIKAYVRFVADGVWGSSPWDQLKQGVFLGTDRFVESLLDQFGGAGSITEVPRAQQQRPRQSLEAIENGAHNRNDAIVLAYRVHSYTLKEIGVHFGLHYSRVSRIVKKRSKEGAKGKT